MAKQDLQTIAIVGRPNVGKSSLFNYLLRRRMSIVHEQSGVTRDRVVSLAKWEGKPFQLIDTGGLGVFSDKKKNVDMWDEGIREQVELAIEGADIIFFMADALDGIVPLDKAIAKKLHASNKQIYCVINKADNQKLDDQCSEFATLGFDTVYPISTLHKRGVEWLLDDALEFVTEDSKDTTEPFKISVLGRPNVGKSSIVNALLDENRVMVSDVAGTTRDSINTPFEMEYRGETLPITLIDTAGIRKRKKVDNVIEIFSIMRAEAAVKKSQLVLFVVEADKNGLTAQDRRISDIIAKENKPCIIVANKWDLCDGERQKKVLDEIYYTLPRMTYAPVVFTCALSKLNFDEILNQVASIMEQMEIHIPTPYLNKVIAECFERNAPPVVGKKRFKVYYGTMLKSSTPKFALFVNNKKSCTNSYLGYMRNFFRKAFNFSGLPIEIVLRERDKKENFINKDKKTGMAKSFKSNVRKKNNRKHKRKIQKR